MHWIARVKEIGRWLVAASISPRLCRQGDLLTLKLVLVDLRVRNDDIQLVGFGGQCIQHHRKLGVLHHKVLANATSHHHLEDVTALMDVLKRKLLSAALFSLLRAAHREAAHG